MSQSSTAGPKKLRMAVIGCGPIGNLHAEAIEQSTQATLAAVCDPDTARRQTTAERFGCAGYEDASALFAGEQLDAVTIATPDHLHFDVALAACAAGCHVFCEKPLATEVDDARQIVEAAREHRVQLAIDYNRRFAFGYRTAKTILNSGKIGALKYALLRVSDGTPPPAVARRPDVIFTTLLTHHLDLMRFYGGEVRSLQAFAGAEPAGGLLRSVSIVLELASGALGTIVAGYRDAQTRTSEWLELGGTSGSIVVEEITRRVILSGLDPDERRVFEPQQVGASADFYASLVQHVQAFILDVAFGAPPDVSGEDGLVGMQLAAAASESLKSGRVVRFSS